MDHSKFLPPRITDNNVFRNLNGWPYLAAHYLDKDELQVIERPLIKNQLMIDNNNPYHTIVDIVVDNVGERSIGNREHYGMLLDTITQNQARLVRQLDVVKSGLLVVVHYNIESERTGRLLRKDSTAQLYTDNRSHYIDTNSTKLNDNAILTNFTDLMVKTIAYRVHGDDRMIVRLTDLKIYYVGLRRPNVDPYVHQLKPRYQDDVIFRPDQPLKNYHFNNQLSYNFNPGQIITPEAADLTPSRMYFSRFYHFEKGGRTIILHDHDINDHRTAVYQIPVASIGLNKQFTVNTSLKVMFRISVWRNDIIVVNNTQRIARLLGVTDKYHRPPHGNFKPGQMLTPEEIIMIRRELARQKKINFKQSIRIKQLMAILAGMQDVRPPFGGGKPKLPSDILPPDDDLEDALLDDDTIDDLVDDDDDGTVDIDDNNFIDEPDGELTNDELDSDLP